MQITGKNHLAVDAATAWAAFHDEGVLERTIPGAHSVRQTDPGRYAITVSAGVAAIKGTYDGEAVFSDETEPESFLLSLSGAGGPGTINADVRVNLVPSDDGTTLDWTADATVGGPVGGVGQRMLSSVAKRLAGQFFNNIDRDLATGGGALAASGEAASQAGGLASAADAGAPGGGAGGAVAGGGGAGGAGAPGAAGTTAAGTGLRPATDRGAGLGGAGSMAAGASGNQLVPMLTGAAIALVGVALGARLRRR